LRGALGQRVNQKMSHGRIEMHSRVQLAPRRSWISDGSNPVRLFNRQSRTAKAVACIGYTLAVVVFHLSVIAQTSVADPSIGANFSTIRSAAEAAREQGNRPLAIQLYSQSVALNPAWPDGWWFLGILQYENDQYEPARDALTHYIELAPPAGPALALRGLCAFEMGQFAESLQDIEQGLAHGAANQRRNTEIILYHEALDLTNLGRFEEAIGKYTAIAKRGGGNPELSIAVGLAGMRMAILPKDVDPSKADLISSVGQASIAVMVGDTLGAENQFQTIFDSYPEEKNIHYLYGYLLLSADPDSAMVEFKKELIVNPESAVAHAMSAWTLSLQGDYAGALPDANEAVTEDPSLVIGQLVYGRALVETGNTIGGLAHLQSVLQVEPGNLEAHMTKAKALSKLGRNEDARRERLLCLSISDQEVSPRAIQ
jgi:tetratricopeptide (TPR) repeat protein